MHTRSGNNRETEATYIPTYLPAASSTYLPTYLPVQPFRLSASETTRGGCWQQQHQQRAGRQQLATPATSSYSISSCWFSPFAFSPVLHDLSSPVFPLLPLCARARPSTSSISSSLKSPPPSRTTYLPYRYHHGTVHTVHTVHSGTIPESHRGHSSCIADNADPHAHIHTRVYTRVHTHVPDIHAKFRLADARTHLRTHTPVYTRTERCIRAYACVHKSTTA